MKAVLFFLFLTTAASAQHHKYILTPGSYYNPVQPLSGDTVYLSKGQYGYVSWGKISGDSLHPIYLTGDSVSMFNGFAFNDCNWWHISKGITVQNNPNTVGVNIDGKSGHFEIDHINFRYIYSAVWFKQEPTLTTDTSRWSTLVLDGLYWHDCTVFRTYFEGGYLGSTDQKFDRRCLAFDGNYYYPKPARVANIKIVNVTFDSTERTGLQVSGGTNVLVDRCTFNVCGLSKESNQGACLRYGLNTQKTTTTRCRFSHSWLYAFQSMASDTVKFANNQIDSATVIGKTINPQPMAAVEFDGFIYPTTLIIKNNTIGYSNNGVGTVVTASKEFLTAAGNIFSNNTGSFQNNSGVIFKTAQ